MKTDIWLPDGVRGVIFTGGNGPAPARAQQLAQGAAYIVAADSGLFAAEAAGVRPDWIVGDFDSLFSPYSPAVPGSRTPAGLAAAATRIHYWYNPLTAYGPDQVQRYPPDKDVTDTEIALALLRKKGCTSAVLVGGGGGRIDHLFAIRALFDGDQVPDAWFTSDADIYAVRDGCTLDLDLAPDRIVSVFPCGNGPWHVRSAGLKWPLDAVAWSRSSSGVSNRTVTGPFWIHVDQGRFLVVHQRQVG